MAGLAASQPDGAANDALATYSRCVFGSSVIVRDRGGVAIVCTTRSVPGVIDTGRRERAVAARREREAACQDRRLCVHASSDWHRAEHAPRRTVHHFHHLVTAPHEQPVVFDVEAPGLWPLRRARSARSPTFVRLYR